MILWGFEWMIFKDGGGELPLLPYFWVLCSFI